MTDLNRLITTIAATLDADLAKQFGDGTVAAVEGGYAAVRKGDPQAPATPGFYVSPELILAVGDHVWYYQRGAFRLVLAVLNRNAVLPDALTIAQLSLTGSRYASGVLTVPALTASVNDYAPDGGRDAYIWRIGLSASWSITGAAADPGAEHLWLNISSHDLTLPHENAGSASANRLLGPGDLNYVVPKDGGVRVWYDALSARWRLV